MMSQTIYDAFTFTHHWISNLLVVLLSITVLWTFIQLLLKNPFKKITGKMAIITVMLADIMLVLGLSLYFFGDSFLGIKSFSYMKEGSVMQNKLLRYYAIEHPIGMLTAILLLHVGNRVMKKAPEEFKNKKLLIWFGIAIVIIIGNYPTFRGMLTSEAGAF